MKFKLLHPSFFIFSSMLALGLARAAPLVSIGDNTDIFFNGSSSLRWASNIFLTEEDEVEDLVWTLSPGFEVNVGRGVSDADFAVITRYDIVRYDDQKDLDVELFHIKAQGAYMTSRLELRGFVSFDETKSNSGSQQFVDELIESDNFASSIKSEYRFSPKFSFGAGAQYNEIKYTDDFKGRLADRETLTLPFDLFYELTPKLDLSSGYSYAESDVDSFSRGAAYTQESNFFNLGARGSLLPKLNGFFRIGYRNRSNSRPGSNDSGMLGLDANLTWTATPKISGILRLSRDFGVGGDGQATENSSVDFSANFSFNNNWIASANLGYALRDYSNTEREDDRYNAGLRLYYTPNRYWRFTGGFTFTDNDSKGGNSYESQVVDLSASLRY